jgi:arylsulfatase A-like enzyme
MDDMGIGDCRVYNQDSSVSMPNLESMARQGMIFTDVHAPAAVCAPTRYSIITGNYPWRGRNPNGTWLFNMPSQVLPGQKTIGQVLKKAGYHTAFLGKVHLGGKVFSKSTQKPKLNMKDGFQDFDFSRKVEDSPASLGFDYAYELPQGIQGSPYIALENGMLVGEQSKLREWKTGTYGKSVIEADGFGSPDWDSSKAGPILTNKAISFLNSHYAENQSRGIRKPFFMYYCSQSCHVPHTPPDELGGEKIKGASTDPHLDMIVEADVTLGKMISSLKSAGELENTLLIFTSDNGGLSRGARGQYKGEHNSNAGFRGSKAQIYEGGHRVPFIARWGNGKQNSQISPRAVSDSLIGLQDIYATLAELTNQPMNQGDGLDSQSFLSSLLGQKNSLARSSLLIQANNGTFHGQQSKKSVRENDWKLITTKELKPIELYDLDNDPMETKKQNYRRIPI